MVSLEKVAPIDDRVFEQIGFHWHTDADTSKYVAGELVVVSDAEAEAYYEAVNELYDMYATAAQHVIDNNLFFDLGIPFNLIDPIKKSWENDVHWHLYGRFDLAGGERASSRPGCQRRRDTQGHRRLVAAGRPGDAGRRPEVPPPG